MNTRFDRRKSLQELEGQTWEEPAWESSLVTTCSRLRRKPLNDFTIEDLRIMIGQEIGLPFLVPIALEHLEKNPLVEGDFYPGDLLVNVLRIPASFWKEHPDLRPSINHIIKRVLQMLPDLDESDRAIVKEALERVKLE